MFPTESVTTSPTSPVSRLLLGTLFFLAFPWVPSTFFTSASCSRAGVEAYFSRSSNNVGSVIDVPSGRTAAAGASTGPVARADVGWVQVMGAHRSERWALALGGRSDSLT